MSDEPFFKKEWFTGLRDVPGTFTGVLSTENGEFWADIHNTTATTVYVYDEQGTLIPGDFTVTWDAVGTMTLTSGGQPLHETADSIIDRFARQLAARRRA